MSKELHPGRNGDLDASQKCNQPGTSSAKHSENISYFTEKGIFSPGGLVDALSPPTLTPTPAPTTEMPSCSRSDGLKISSYNSGVSTSRKKLQPIQANGLPRANSTEPDVYACEKALVIDHILEKIFSYSDIASLKNFRLVSHRWRLFGAKELQKLVTIEFQKNDKNNYVLRKIAVPSTNVSQHRSSSRASKPSSTNAILENAAKFGLENFIALMRSCNVFPYFPCKFFTFCARNLNDAIFQDFFIIHGHHIKTLRLNLRYGTMRECAEDLPSLRRILVDQVPNLECFQLQVRLHDGWEKEDEREFLSLLERPNESEQWCRNGGAGKKMVNLKLKTMEFYWELPRSIFETVVRLAPNLKQVTLDSRYMNYLIEPTNRIHLLKKIMIFLWHGNLESWENMLRHDDYLQLQDICFYLSSIYNDQPVVLERVAAIINRILEASCSSLEKVLWAPMSCLPGIKIPRMPKVKELLFGDYYWKTSEAQNFFPEGTSLSLIFPNLQTVCFAFGFLSDSDMNALNSCFNNFDPVPTVRNICIKNVDQLSTTFVEHVSKWFPNAKFM